MGKHFLLFRKENMMASSMFSLASSCAMMLFVLVFLSSSMVKGLGDFDINMSPSLSPFFDKLCDEINCGRGNCSVDAAKPFNFVCQCDPGWKRTRSNDDEDRLQFLPCVIPNCSLDYSCMPAPPPSPPIPDNYSSIFDPCYWTYCGEGSCTKDDTYKHTCECNTGYTNLMNVSHFPCFSNCALGSDCRRLGIRVLDDTSSPPGGSSQGTKFLPGGFYWIGITSIYMVMALWK